MSLEHSLCFFFGAEGPLSPEMKDLMGTSHTRLNLTKFLSLCVMSCCGFLCLILTAAAGNFSEGGWARHDL